MAYDIDLFTNKRKGCLLMIAWQIRLLAQKKNYAFSSLLSVVILRLCDLHAACRVIFRVALNLL
jgi:hypothetical protein